MNTESPAFLGFRGSQQIGGGIGAGEQTAIMLTSISAMPMHSQSFAILFVFSMTAPPHPPATPRRRPIALVTRRQTVEGATPSCRAALAAVMPWP